MYKKRRFKPIQKKMISLGLAAAMLMAVPSQNMLSYAMTDQSVQDEDVQEQSVESESGYRLYADELTSASGAVKGDMTEVLPGYEIINVKLPDGSLAKPEEVNFPVTESGDYVFEVIYHSASNGTDPAKTAEEQSLEQGVEEQSTSDALPESAGDTESEELTLTVTLPEEEATEEPASEERAEPVEEEIQSAESEQQEVAVSNAPISLQTIPNVSARATEGAEWDTEFDYYGSRLNWTRDRFKNYTTYWGSTGGMNYAGDDQSLTGSNTNYRQGDNGYALSSADTPTFRWGYYNRTGSTYNWIQYSQGFSDISVNLSKDFALGGTMIIGSAFGSLDPDSEGAKRGYAGLGGTGLVADGGLTISLLPTGRQNEIIASSSNGLSGVQRLGAYGVFKDAIIMEFDVGHQNGYASITGSTAPSFHIMNPEAELQRVGDYRIYNSDLSGLELGGHDNIFYSKYKFPSVASQSHIGISVTGANGYVNSEDRSSERRFIWGGDTGSFDYKIEYRAGEGKMYYSVRHTGTGTWEYVTECTIPTAYRNKQYTVAASFSAIYQDSSKFTSSGGYFNGATNANTGSGIGPGQMELTIQGVYSQPALENLDNQVVFMENNTNSLSEGTTSVKAYQQGYVGSSDSEQVKQNKRSYFPLEGDKIVIQNQADISALFNETAPVTGDITLTSLSFRDLKFVDSSGKPITDIPPGLNISSINEIDMKYYYSVNGGQKWIPCSKENTSLSQRIGTGTQPLRWRVVITLPQTKDVTDSTNTQFWLTGETLITVSRGGSTATFNLPWYKDNSEKVTFFSDPKDVGANGLAKNTARVIRTDGLSILSGSKTSGQTDAVSYGLDVWYNSTRRQEAYNPSYAQQDQTYEYKSIDQILAASSATTSTGSDTDISLSDNTRYIVDYSLYDSVFNEGDKLSKLPTYTGNMDRAKATTKRVIWRSDNVTVGNGYEFYMKPSVTMTAEDFDGFNDLQDKASYYQKIAKAAEAIVFKTSSFDWNNLVGSSGTISGTGTHTGIENALKNPGTPYDVTIRYQGSDGARIEKTIKLTIADSTPKVVSVSDSTIKNETAEKIIFNKEDYTVSATFKLVDGDGSDIVYSDINWAEIEPKIKVAIYKKNGPDAAGSKTNFHRWANRADYDNDADDGNGHSKIGLPVDITDNKNGTFTVTYTLLNNSKEASDANWVQATWENGAQWRIYAWTETNEAAQDYTNLEDTTTDQISASAVDSKVPSVTTTMSMISRDDAGNLPTTMFRISQVQLTNKGDNNRVTDVRDTTTISLTQVEGVTKPNEALHDYYYQVSVNETQNDRQNRPYTILTQEVTGKSFWARYYRYNTVSGSYEEVKQDNLVLGNISYPSNEPDYPSSIRFGMWADNQDTLTDGLVTDKPFTGQANFKFTRKSISQ